MNAELQAVISYLEKERGIARETLFELLESALLSASRKSIGPAHNLRIEIDRQTCDIRAFATAEVVDKVTEPHDQVTLSKARQFSPDAEVGQMVDVEVTPQNFGRIAAQTAKQAIMQKIRKVEKDIIYEEYKDRIGDVVSGAVRSFERSDVIVDLGRAEAVMPSKERVPTEEYQIGDRLRALVLNIQNSPGGPDLILSRSHPNFVRRLFELEVAEIAEGIVEIKGIAREPGYRSKIAVVSHDEKVDPVGACVGMRGIRVKNIVRELSGEKIDIVRWSDDPRVYVTNALSPATLKRVEVVDGETNTIRVVADSDQLSLAIGKRGQNVRLTAKLVGWKVDIQKDESELTFERKVEEAVEQLAQLDGLTREDAQGLVGAGFLTAQGILETSAEELAEMTDMSLEDAQRVHAAAASSSQANTATEAE